jgi:hypothetical protein
VNQTVLKWALLRLELPKQAVCCERIAQRHREFVREIPSRLLTVKLKYTRRTLRCTYCGTWDTLTGLLVVNPPDCIQRIARSPTCYLSADILEIDEGEYDASKPPAYFPEEI